MVFSIIALWLIYLASVTNDLNVIKHSKLADNFDIATIIILLVCVVIIVRKHSFTILQTLGANVHIFGYTVILFFVQLYFHELSSAQWLRLFAFGIVGIMAYVVLAGVLVNNSILMNKWFQIVAFTSGFLSLTAVFANLGLTNFFGLSFSEKFGAYNMGFIHASGGILEHPLTLGAQTLLGIGCSSYLLNKKPNLTHWLLMILNLLGMLLAMGRGSWLAAIVAIFATNLFVKRRRGAKTAFILFFFAVFYLFVSFFPFNDFIQRNEFLNNILRINYGSSGRDELWLFALPLILRQPWVGYGAFSAPNLKWIYGGSRILQLAPDSGFHNIFIDSSLESGVVVAAIYFLLFLIPIYRLIRADIHFSVKKPLLFIVVSMTVATLFVNFNIGGVRSTSLAMAVFLGIANLSNGRETLKYAHPVVFASR